MAKRPPVVAGVARVGAGAVPVVHAPVAAPVPAQVAGQAHVQTLVTKGGAVSSNAGAVPPLGAPHEIAQPLQSDAGGVLTADGLILTPSALAAQHERTLAPLTYGQVSAGAVPGPVVAAGVVHAPRPVQPAAAPARPPQEAVGSHAAQPARPVLAAGGPGAAIAAVIRARPAVDQPAASHTDSPSRGVPRPITNLGKAITGGFGDAAGSQYFPLDGSELLKVVWVIMDELGKRIVNDLRFSPAITYPRVAVRCAITVEGFAEDQTFTIERVGPVHDRTPLAMAQALGDEIVFVVKTERREFDRVGNVQSPPNALRAEIGVVPPRKQVVGSGNNRQVVDVVV